MARPPNAASRLRSTEAGKLSSTRIGPEQQRRPSLPAALRVGWEKPLGVSCVREDVTGVYWKD